MQEQLERSSTQQRHDQETTVVIDAGARYGMHPAWRGFDGPMRYFAFEPDPNEAARLQALAKEEGYEVLDWGLAKQDGSRSLNITSHRGCCSFLEVDPESEWFGRYRPGEGRVESQVQVKTCSIDGFAGSRGVDVDFLKVDTEGTELDVLEGAAEQLSSAVMGVRVNVNFLAAYKGQALFPAVHEYLTAQGFYLLNLDYFGRGVPRHGLFRNPDPLSLDSERYGVLVATDGVWLREYGSVERSHQGDDNGLAFATLKYVYFCFLNHAADVGLDTLLGFAERPEAFGPRVMESRLYKALRRTCAAHLGRWRVRPDEQWVMARDTFKQAFGLELEGGNRYWELIDRL